jgi:short-subunit dehydrogenase
VALVTGASRGLGRHVALALGRRGVKVGLCARTAGDLERLAAEIRAAGGAAQAAPADVARCSEVEGAAARVREALGPIDLLINNAGVGWYKPFVEWTQEEIERALDVNLKGTVWATRAVLPGMLERGRGQIVNIASDLGRRILPNMAVYAAAKHGVVGFAGSLLREVKGRGVKVMTLTPGIIDTWFGGGREGTREATWAMSPSWVADFVVSLLELPPHWLADEVSLHPLHQDF